MSPTYLIGIEAAVQSGDTDVVIDEVKELLGRILHLQQTNRTLTETIKHQAVALQNQTGHLR